MAGWLAAALDYLPRWLEFQVRLTRQPGCVIAVAHRGRVVLERAFGVADANRGTRLTPRHRFRVASHSKSFTAAGIMRLREQRRVRLDTAVGTYVSGLHRDVAKSTLRELLSHGAGILRDGPDSGQWDLRRAFLNEKELRADLRRPPAIAADTRLKYSNHGFGLLGLVIEEVTGESFHDWIRSEVVDAAGLNETYPDAPVPRGVPMSNGHTSVLPFGARRTLGRDLSTRGLAAATGFVSTARDLVRFFGQLDPAAPKSFLGVGSRREMTRAHRPVPGIPSGRAYGLGVARGISPSMSPGGGQGWPWYGHAGGFPGYLTRTSVVPSEGLAISVLTNAIDGPSQQWSDGALGILQTFAKRGTPTATTRRWRGRWWTLWGAIDLVPAGNRVLLAAPALIHPFAGAGELRVRGRRGSIVEADGYASFGERAAIVRAASGRELKLGGTRYLPEGELVRVGRRRSDG